MPRAEPRDFRCLDCNRWMRTSAWSRYAGAQRCPVCYRRRAEELARPILERLQQERSGDQQLDLPDF
jgi:hypothetical protein